MDMKFTEYSYKSFKNEDLIPDENEILDLNNLDRIDYFNFWNISEETYQKIDTLYSKYAKDFEKYDWDEKDFIFFRCIFKEFVVRFKVIDKNMSDIDNYIAPGGYIRFKIIDNFPGSNINEKILSIQYYLITSGKSFNMYSVRIKLTHKDLILNNVENTIKHYELKLNDNHYDDAINKIKNLNLHVLPIYVYNKKSKKYESISTLKDRKDYDSIYNIFSGIAGNLRTFNALNYYMLCKLENNDNMDFLKSDNSIVSSSLVEYMKYEAHEDKKIRIRIDNDVNLNLYTKNDNIYSHDNKVVRKLCDYRFMVSAHWHHYWVGSKKDGTAHRIRKWVESYEKNKDKQYKIIREMYKGKEETI